MRTVESVTADRVLLTGRRKGVGCACVAEKDLPCHGRCAHLLTPAMPRWPRRQPPWVHPATWLLHRDGHGMCPQGMQGAHEWMHAVRGMENDTQKLAALLAAASSCGPALAGARRASRSDLLQVSIQECEQQHRQGASRARLSGSSDARLPTEPALAYSCTPDSSARMLVGRRTWHDDGCCSQQDRPQQPQRTSVMIKPESSCGQA